MWEEQVGLHVSRLSSWLVPWRTVTDAYNTTSDMTSRVQYMASAVASWPTNPMGDHSPSPNIFM